MAPHSYLKRLRLSALGYILKMKRQQSMLQFLRNVRGTEHQVGDDASDSATIVYQNSCRERAKLLCYLICADTACAHNATLEEDTDTMSASNSVLQAGMWKRKLEAEAVEAVLFLWKRKRWF